jgi:neurocan core protein
VKGQHHEKIRCTASSKPKADITWLKDDQPIDSARYASETDGIRIRGPSAEMDSGRYTVMAAVSETGLLELRDIVVQTHVRPTIIDLPEFEQAVEGDKVKLSCKAQAVPHAVYSWIDPNNRNLSTVPGYSVNSESGDLIIDFVDKERDRGSFKCIASNAAGQDEKSVNMRITTRPVITRLENVSSIEGGEAVLTCIATGNPAPRLIFKREGEENRELFNGQQRIRLDSWDKDSESRLVLTVSQVDRRDSGLYFCRAENVAGFREQASHLQVEFRPDLSRTQTVVKSWQGNTVNITCLADAIPNATIKWYDFRNRQIDSDMRDTRYKVFNYPGESKLQIVCSDNAVYTNYKCQASNQHGDSEVIISLQEATVPDMVSEVILVKKSPQSLAYKITPPLRDGGLPVIRFHVKYTEIQYGQASQDPRDWRHHSWPANAQVYYIDNLRGRTAYELRFAAENEVGKGPESEMVREELPDESQPEPVQIIQDDPSKDPHSGDVLSRYSRSFTLKWTEPQDNGRKIESYEIKYYKVREE